MLDQTGSCSETGKSLVVCINYNYPGPSLAEQVASWAWAVAAVVLTIALLWALLTAFRPRRGAPGSPAPATNSEVAP